MERVEERESEDNGLLEGKSRGNTEGEGCA